MKRYRPSVCPFCKTADIETEYNVGSDVDPSGEEDQHIDTCRKCGAWRFNIDRWEGFSKYVKVYGEWHPKEVPHEYPMG